ncbi:flagellar protein FliT [Metabacillus crassostreae]|uniref:hypothetical protein n=1 Tax=Metabacillus crassostreae TaxID=929098 RepID=UPI00195B6312|nr:hypothetical protein [Metabacillus crassostreae]MBM7606230.1 flagellar protein FliT [Metabacillus crassostreae]
MRAIEKVHDVTEQLFQLVSKSVPKEERDEQVKKITTLLDMREQDLKNVQPPFSQIDSQLFQQIVDWNRIITNKLSETKKEIQLDMLELKKKKSSNQQYVNPFEDVSSSDGMFYDKRK